MMAATGLYRLGQAVAALALALIAAVTVGDVVLRFVFNKPIFGASEITEALLAVVVGAGLIVVAGLRNHICVDLFDVGLHRRFPRAYPGWIATWEFLGTLALLVLMVRHAWHAIVDGERTAVLEMPSGFVFAAVAALVAAALYVLVAAKRLSVELGEDLS
ncbi:MAG: TRAP transporter small permease [Polaromonas sp.]